MTCNAVIAFAAFASFTEVNNNVVAVSHASAMHTCGNRRMALDGLLCTQYKDMCTAAGIRGCASPLSPAAVSHRSCLSQSLNLS